MKLVDPLEYRTTKNIYGGNSYQIACELDITFQIIQDYRWLLDSNTTIPIIHRTINRITGGHVLLIGWRTLADDWQSKGD